jgi:hypothetical protein
MANDIPVYESCTRELFGRHALMASDYAVIEYTGTERVIKVRGSKYIEFDGNYFRPAEARRLANYILELADDAEKDPAVDEFASDLEEVNHQVYGYYVGEPLDELAKLLIKMGYRKSV